MRIGGFLLIRLVYIAIIEDTGQHPHETCPADALFARERNVNPCFKQGSSDCLPGIDTHSSAVSAGLHGEGGASFLHIGGK